MPATLSEYCPWCNKYTAITPAPLVAILFGNMVHPIDETMREATGNQWNGIPLYRRGESWMGKCNACEKPVLVIGIQSPRIFPTPQPLPVSDDIPEPMRSDLYEARLCQSIGAFNASVVMARRALQCAAVQQGATPGKKLWEQTQELLRSGAITKSMYEWTEAARWVGNHGAHDTEPDATDGRPGISDVTQDDAEDMLHLMEQFFDTLYVSPAIAKEQLEKRNKQPLKLKEKK